MTPPFKPGDKVVTNFYPKDRALIRVVTKVYQRKVCKSGWFVTTRDEHGRVLDCDAHWYRKQEVATLSTVRGETYASTNIQEAKAG